MDYSPSALLSIEFSRLDWVTIFFFSSPGDLPDPGNQPRSPALQKDTLTTEPPGLSRTNTKKKKKRERERDVLFIIEDWNAKVGGKFGLGILMKQAKLTQFCQENTLVIANTLFQQHKR